MSSTSYIKKDDSISVRLFEVLGRYYNLRLNLSTDATEVFTEEGSIGLVFDSSTYIHLNNKVIGKIRPPFGEESPYMKVTLFDKLIETNINHNKVECYLDTEVFVTEYLIENNLIKLD